MISLFKGLLRLCDHVLRKIAKFKLFAQSFHFSELKQEQGKEIKKIDRGARGEKTNK